MANQRIHKFKDLHIKKDGVELELKTRRIERNFNKAQYALDSAVMTSMVPFMPHRDGSFIQRTRAESAAIAGSGKVVAAAAPFGRFLYEGKVMVDPVTGSAWARKGARKILTDRDISYSKAHNPRVQSHWFEPAKKADKEKWIRKAKKIAGGG
jgi:hypothetical protein